MTKKEKLKKMAGGVRKGAGRPREYKERTEQVGFAVPISHAISFREYCRLFLDPLKIKKL